MPKLHDLYKSVERRFNDLAMQFKYWRQVLYSFSAWMDTQFFPWLAGYLANISPGTIIVENSGCHDIFCLLTNVIDGILRPIVDTILSLINQAANLLFGVVGGAILLVIQVLTSLVTLLHIAMGLLTTIITSFINAEPVVPPGFPDCTTDPTGGICVVWWIAENTILSGPIGALYIPTMTAIGWTLLALHVVSEIKRIIHEVGRSL